MSDDGGQAPELALSRVMDHALLDRDGRRAGRVDDLQFDLIPGSDRGEPPKLVLRAIVSGPLARPVPKVLRTIARACYRLVGLTDPGPVTVGWSHVTAIDALVHLDVGRSEVGLRAVDEAAGHLVEKLPGSRKG